jgi:transcriptional regulator with XRE-family HTH domain
MTCITHEHPLRTWRKSKGWTLEKAARQIGTSRQVWGEWERGLHRPGPNLMPKVRELTDGTITADTFFPGKEAA